MYTYAIILPTGSTVTEEDVQAIFPGGDCIEAVDGAVWLAGSKLETCADVSEKFKSPGKEHHPEKTHIVLKITEFNGFANVSLWQKLIAWQGR